MHMRFSSPISHPICSGTLTSIDRGFPFRLPPLFDRGNSRQCARALFRSVFDTRTHTTEYTRSRRLVTTKRHDTPRGT